MTLRELAERIAARMRPETAETVSSALARASALMAQRRAIDAVDDLTRALGELDELESVIDRQTYHGHRAANFNMPDDCELDIVLTAKDERRLTRAIRLISGALRVLQKDDVRATDKLTMEKG